jgi:hypothetical protein
MITSLWCIPLVPREAEVRGAETECKPEDAEADEREWFRVAAATASGSDADERRGMDARRKAEENTLAVRTGALYSARCFLEGDGAEDGAGSGG